MFKKTINLLKVKIQALSRLNDSIQRICLGLGLGVTLGIIPGTGPFAAIALALLLRLNSISALIASIVSNTWLSFIALPLAIKLGAKILSLNQTELYQDWLSVIKDFCWLSLAKLSIYKLLFPILLGYLVLGLGLGITVYLSSWFILSYVRKRDTEKK